jgi:aminoglycoside phosphotransferase family enzyme/predicted kinase
MPEAADPQDTVLAFLGDPLTHSGSPVRRIDTHAAVVFLAGARALKVKRAVRFPFLDYSTLEKRKAACLAELEVNRAFAPELYRRVVAIVRRPDGRLALDGDGEAVEWAVEMLRFDESRTLDHLAQAGAIDDALADRLAEAVAAMHAAAAGVEAGSWLAAIADFLEQNTAAFREMPALFPAEAAARLDQAARAALQRLRPLLVARGELGFIRRGHGDLHLGNIVLLRGRPVPFDAIEFDPIVAAGDVLYDLAFLLMDLAERRLDSAASIVLNGYLARARRVEHFDGLAALPFFMSLRAAIRAKVTAARLHHAGSSDQEAIRAAAKAYFQLAVRLLSPPPPMLVAVGGLSGTGKSTLARALAPFVEPIPGAVVLRSDVERKALFGVQEHERLPPEAYRLEVGAQVYSRLAESAARIVAAGHSAIVDAMFGQPEERKAIAAVAASAGVPFRGLFLASDLNTRLSRIATRSLDASDADAAVARRQEAYSLGPMEWAQIDASGPLQSTVEHARAAIA